MKGWSAWKHRCIGKKDGRTALVNARPQRPVLFGRDDFLEVAVRGHCSPIPSDGRGLLVPGDTTKEKRGKEAMRQGGNVHNTGGEAARRGGHTPRKDAAGPFHKHLPRVVGGENHPVLAHRDDVDPVVAAVRARPRLPARPRLRVVADHPRGAVVVCHVEVPVVWGQKREGKGGE